MSDTDTLKDAIEDLESSAKVLGRVEFLWERDDVVPTYEMENAQKAVNAARSSLESLYREQTAEIAEAREILLEGKPDCADDTLPSLLRLAVGSFRTRLAELSALRSLQLTEEERQFITDGLLLHAPGWRIPEALSEKLRISSKATSEEL